MNNLKSAIYAAIIAVFFASGWWVRGLVEAKKDLVELSAATQAINAEMSRESEISKLLEDKLAKWDTKQWIVYHEKQKIIDRPVYLNVCLDADGVQLINRAKTPPTTEPVSGVPATP